MEQRESELHPIHAGVPQGSCLGPPLWIMYINDLLRLIPKVKTYTDDLILTHSYSLEEEATANSQLNTMMSRIVAWGNRWQVEFAPHKTKLLSVSEMCASPCLNLRRWKSWGSPTTAG